MRMPQASGAFTEAFSDCVFDHIALREAVQFVFSLIKMITLPIRKLNIVSNVLIIFSSRI